MSFEKVNNSFNCNSAANLISFWLPIIEKPDKFSISIKKDEIEMKQQFKIRYINITRKPVAVIKLKACKLMKINMHIYHTGGCKLHD